MTDVTFLVQGNAIKGHRIVVMSYGGMLQELLEANAGQIEIEDITPQTFKTVLEYVYKDVCDISPLNVFELMYASKVFGLTDLERECANYIQESLNLSNIGAYYTQALLFDSTEYIEVCQAYFKTNTLEFIASTGFLEVSNEVLVTLCSSESVSCSPLQLFLACVEWAKSECKRQKRQVTPENLRTVLGQVLTKLRFQAIPWTDLLESVLPLEILPFEDVGRIITEVLKKENVLKKEKRTEFSDVDIRSPVKVIIMILHEHV